jgi:hypothetical protein
MSENRRSPSGPVDSVSASGTILVPALPAGVPTAVSVSVPGAKIGDTCVVSLNGPVLSPLNTVTNGAFCAADDTVTVVLNSIAGFAGGNESLSVSTLR